MLKMSFALPINVAPELLWKHYQEFDLRKIWEEDLEEYVLHGPFATGTQGTIRLKGMPSIQFTLTSVTPNQEFWDHVELEGMGVLRFGHELFKQNETWYIKHTIVFEPVSGKVEIKDLAFFKKVSGDLPDTLWRLKYQVEKS